MQIKCCLKKKDDILIVKKKNISQINGILSEIQARMLG